MSLYDILACPVCKTRVVREEDTLRCTHCQQTYPIVNGVPVMFPDGRAPVVQHEAELVVQKDYYPWVHRVILQSLLDNQVVLDVGCGNMGLDDPCIIRLDVTMHPYVDIVADVHALPFLPQSIDYIFSLAVVEHLRQPFLAAQSMYEALKDGGYIYHECNFVFAYHGYPHHYFNASLQGMEQVFSQFTHLRKGVAPYQMPSLALLMVLDTYLRHSQAGEHEEGALWVDLLQKVLRLNTMWFDRYFNEKDALYVAAGTYLSGYKQLTPRSSLIPPTVRQLWSEDKSLQSRFPDINNLATAENILVWAKDHGRRAHPQIDAYLSSLEPFNKRGPSAPFDRSSLRSWPVVEPEFGAHPKGEPPDVQALRLYSDAEDLLQSKEEAIRSLQAQLRDWELRWEDLERGAGWKLLRRFRELRLRAAPLGSRRDRALRLPYKVVRVWRNEGAGAIWRAALRRVRPGETGLTEASPPVEAAPSVEAAPHLMPSPTPQPSETDRYQAWLAENEPGSMELAAQRQVSSVFPKQPLISILLDLGNDVPFDALQTTLDTLCGQTYPNWEARITANLVDGMEELIRLAEQDARINLQPDDPLKSTTPSSIEILEKSQGEFVLWMQPGDRLSPNALYEMVYLVNEDPQADLIYFDEDRLDGDGTTRMEPFLKPDWSPELMLSVNCLGRPLLSRPLLGRSLAAASSDGELQSGPGRDWDLALRSGEQARRICHIPKILYHRGTAQNQPDSGSQSALSRERKSAALAIEKHLERSGIHTAAVSSPQPGLYRATWPVKGSKVTIIIPTKNRVDMLEKTLNSVLEKTDYPDLEVILVDNGSDKSTWDYYQKYQADERLDILDFSQPFNFSAANNYGAQRAAGEFLLFLNNDIQALTPDWLEEMVRWAELPEIGVVGAKLLTPRGTIQHAGVIMGMGAYAGHIFLEAPGDESGLFGSVNWYRDYSAVTGACMMMRRKVFEETGGFDENYDLALSDVEICLRIRARGYRILYTPFARLVHYEGSTRAGYIPARDLSVGYLHMKPYVQAGDRHYNPNLSYAGPIPALLPKGEATRLERFERFFQHYAETGVPPSQA